MAKREAHGGTGTKLYYVWDHMRTRCTNKKDKSYARYGGRGITFIPEWNSFLNFKSWAHSNGYADGLSLDRADNEKGYSPENCKWSTRSEQQRNKRNNALMTKDGKTQPIAAWAEELSMKFNTLWNRKDRGWTDEEALSTPAGAKRGDAG